MLKPGDLSRRVPSLREHLGDEPRAEGFEELAAEVVATQLAGLPPEEAKFVRILETFMVACVEQMNREERLDPTPEGISSALSMWSRAAGYSTIMAIASVSRPNAGLRRIARIMTEEFKIGAKMAADEASARAEAAAQEGKTP